jgi:hypothetical protein
MSENAQLLFSWYDYTTNIVAYLHYYIVAFLAAIIDLARSSS